MVKTDLDVDIDLAQLNQACAQLLQTMQRCGIRHFLSTPQSLDVEASSWIDRLVSTNSPDSTAQLTYEKLQPSSANPNKADESHHPSEARSDVAPLISNRQSNESPNIAVPAAAEPVAVGHWLTAALTREQRLEKLAALNDEVRACRACVELINYRRQTVFGEGNVMPRVCFYGEAPGADEDAQGRPFVGAAGKLLTDIIRAMKLTREEVYILNTLKCRPPQNRTPLAEEIDSCRRFAMEQLEILQPEFIILLGAVSVRSVLNKTDSVGRLRGRFHPFRGAKVLVTYHPAYLLREPSAKRLVWTDVQMVMRELEQ